MADVAQDRYLRQAHAFPDGRRQASSLSVLGAEHSPMAGRALLAGAVLAHDVVYLTVYTRLVLSEMFQELATGTLPRALYTAVVGAGIGVLVDAVSGRRLHRFGRSRFANR